MPFQVLRIDRNRKKLAEPPASAAAYFAEIGRNQGILQAFRCMVWKERTGDKSESVRIAENGNIWENELQYLVNYGKMTIVKGR